VAEASFQLGEPLHALGVAGRLARHCCAEADSAVSPVDAEKSMQALTFATIGIFTDQSAATTF